MGIISKRLTVYGRHRKRAVEVLFDTGASDSFIRASVAAQLGPAVELPEPKSFEMVRGRFKVREAFVGDVAVGRHRLTGFFLIVSDLSEEVIVGADFLQRWHIRLEPRRRRIILDPKALRLIAVSAWRR